MKNKFFKKTEEMGSLDKQKKISFFSKVKKLFKRNLKEVKVNDLNKNVDYNDYNKKEIDDSVSSDEPTYYSLVIKYVNSESGKIINEASEEITIEEGKPYKIIRKGKIIKGYKSIDFSRTFILNSNQVIEIPIILQQSNANGRGVNIF